MNSHQRRVRRRAEARYYEDFLTALAYECDCCPNCTARPCAGCAAGGFCDRYCSCGELSGGSSGRDDDGYDDEYEDDNR